MLAAVKEIFVELRTIRNTRTKRKKHFVYFAVMNPDVQYVQRPAALLVSLLYCLFDSLVTLSRHHQII